MHARRLACVVAVTVLGTFVWAAGCTSTQAPPEGVRTPWGEPDLQGIWTDPYDINLQRPAALGTRELYTEEEVAELDRRRIGAEVRPRAERGALPTSPAPMTGSSSRCGRRDAARR